MLAHVLMLATATPSLHPSLPVLSSPAQFVIRSFPVLNSITSLLRSAIGGLGWLVGAAAHGLGLGRQRGCRGQGHLDSRVHLRRAAQADIMRFNTMSLAGVFAASRGKAEIWVTV